MGGNIEVWLDVNTALIILDTRLSYKGSGDFLASSATY
jgi:hypothetical protein